MNNIIRRSLLFLYLSLPIVVQSANPSRLFEDYKNRSKNSILPDFSYVGYYCGEKEIPNSLNYKVFDVTKFGAIPNDDKSDKMAIQKAIDAANKNGSGIVFFPKGRFLVNEDNDSTNSIISQCSKIILRGSGSGKNGTELFMKNTLQPTNPKQMWTTPILFQMNALGVDAKIGRITNNAPIGAISLTLSTTDGLHVNDWVVLKMRGNAPEIIEDAVCGHKTDSTWTELLQKGAQVQVFYKVVSIDGLKITLHAPIAYAVNTKYKWEVYKFAHVEEVGIEDLAFVGNWRNDFVHHRSWKDDSGFSLLKFTACVNSWMRNCRFTDCNCAAVTKRCANMTIKDCEVTGFAGHNAISADGSTNMLLLNLTDRAGMWHSFGVAEPSMNTVISHCTYPANTCFESHASQPRNTLFDCVTGGLLNNRGGGALYNMPNHLTGLVMWNYTQTNEAWKDFEFWPTVEVNKWWRIPNPIIAGFVSKGTSFKKEQLGALESLGKAVEPQSLYQAQLTLRLKK